MLETIREYAAERLHESGAEADLGGRHAEFFVALAEEAEGGIYGGRQLEWLDRLDGELPNIRSALASLLERRAGCPGASPVHGDLDRSGRRAVRATGGAGSRRGCRRRNPSPTEIRARGLFAYGHLMLFAGDYRRARELLEAAVALSRELGDTEGLTLALSRLSWVALEQGRLDDADTVTKEGLGAPSRRRGAVGSRGGAELFRHRHRRDRRHAGLRAARGGTGPLERPRERPALGGRAEQPRLDDDPHGRVCAIARLPRGESPGSARKQGHVPYTPGPRQPRSRRAPRRPSGARSSAPGRGAAADARARRAAVISRSGTRSPPRPPLRQVTRSAPLASPGPPRPPTRPAAAPGASPSSSCSIGTCFRCARRPPRRSARRGPRAVRCRSRRRSRTRSPVYPNRRRSWSPPASTREAASPATSWRRWWAAAGWASCGGHARCRWIGPSRSS